MSVLHYNLLSHLDDHHARVLELIQQGDMLFASSVPPDQGLMRQACGEFAGVLGAYQRFKHHELFDPIIDDGPPDKARLAQQMKAECITLSEEYHAHAAHGASIDIPAHWGSYRGAVARLLARINAHIRRERWIAASLLIEPVRARVFGTDPRNVAQF